MARMSYTLARHGVKAEWLFNGQRSFKISGKSSPK
jgi:hypothetical protein